MLSLQKIVDRIVDIREDFGLSLNISKYMEILKKQNLREKLLIRG